MKNHEGITTKKCRIEICLSVVKKVSRLKLGAITHGTSLNLNVW